MHDDSLELTEFKGRFSPFNLDNFESKVCRLALGDKYEEDVFEQQDAPQRRYSDPSPRAQNMEEYEGMGFNENNYSPIPLVSGVTSQHGNSRPTSTLKPTELTSRKQTSQTVGTNAKRLQDHLDTRVRSLCTH